MKDSKNTAKRQIDIKTRLFCDTAAAFGAGFTVAPMITPVDVAVTSSQSGKQKIVPAFLEQVRTMFLRPQKFFLDKPYLWIFSVYTFTYTANNCIDSLCKIYGYNDVVPKLVGVTAVNMTLSILKDAALARYFGTKPPGKVPTISYFIWLVRDALSMAAAFIIPSRVSKLVEKKYNMEKPKAEKTSQFLTPILFQTVLLPVHLIGLDYYNVDKSSMASRLKRIFKVYPGALPLRFFRMGSAYGIGGVNNKSFRNKFISKYEGKDWDKNY